MITRERPPTFLKRDLSSPLDCYAVDEVLECHRVLPLNSPPAYPRYNASMERGSRGWHASIPPGRNNRSPVGDEKAGPNIAAVLPINEACRRVGIDPRTYRTSRHHSETGPSLASMS